MYHEMDVRIKILGTIVTAICCHMHTSLAYVMEIDLEVVKLSLTLLWKNRMTHREFIGDF